jgi:hypothetical protein
VYKRQILQFDHLSAGFKLQMQLFD